MSHASWAFQAILYVFTWSLLAALLQVWEESAAKHVSLGPLLAQVAALAQRWRKMELESWTHLLDKVGARHAQGGCRRPLVATMQPARPWNGR